MNENPKSATPAQGQNKDKQHATYCSLLSAAKASASISLQAQYEIINKYTSKGLRSRHLGLFSLTRLAPMQLIAIAQLLTLCTRYPLQILDQIFNRFFKLALLLTYHNDSRRK